MTYWQRRKTPLSLLEFPEWSQYEQNLDQILSLEQSLTLVVGRVGCGKTLFLTWFFHHRPQYQVFWLPCFLFDKDHPSCFSYLLKQHKIDDGSNPLQAFQAYCATHRVILILEGIESISQSLLYTLLEMKRLGLIATSSHENVLSKMEQRIFSRFQLRHTLCFSRLTKATLIAIYEKYLNDHSRLGQKEQKILENNLKVSQDLRWHLQWLDRWILNQPSPKHILTEEQTLFLTVMLMLSMTCSNISFLMLSNEANRFRIQYQKPNSTKEMDLLTFQSLLEEGYLAYEHLQSPILPEHQTVRFRYPAKYLKDQLLSQTNKSIEIERALQRIDL